jgi:16S rRNA (cytosine1402-N4)-methyltransferase
MPFTLPVRAFFRPAESVSPGFAVKEFHVPVLVDEVLELLQPSEGKVFLDGTLGGGGHSDRLLQAGATVIGLDQDAEALAQARGRLRHFGDRFLSCQANFCEARAAIEALGIKKLDGVLLDLGVSSHQLDTAGRGFSFQQNGPLDMRMNPQQGRSAADILNSAPVEELIRIFRDYGEEPHAARLASRVVHIRQQHEFRTTFDLVAAVESVVRRHGPRQPATRAFQALRIAVNEELDVLSSALPELSDLLSPGGRMAVITFHSLEDRIVKRYFRHRSTPTVDRPEWPEPRANPDFCFQLLTSSPLVASASEVLNNPRARSAKLRGVQKLPNPQK